MEGGRPLQTDERFRQALAQLLEQEQISLRGLSKRVGISPGHISRVMRGEKPLTPDILKRMSDALGVTPEYFVEGRRAVVQEAIVNDDRLMERIYLRLPRGP